MPSDSKFTRDENGDIAVRVVTETEQLPASDPNWMFARDTNGNIAVRVVIGEGGGGGDAHNKGWFATQAALEAAYATAEAGDYAIVGSTDTVWVWDTDNSEWVDTGAGGAVTSVNNQTGDVTLGINDVAPSQTGYSGRVLGTDGFVAGWVEPEKIQRTAMPQASEDETGNIYQYVGATTDTYTNGYFYKCVQETEPTPTVTFESQDISFNPAYAHVLNEFIASFGIPNYEERLDQLEISFRDNAWSLSIDESSQGITWIGLEDLTSAQLEELGFVLPAVDPEPFTAYPATIAWSSENVRRWKHLETGAYIPVYTTLPAPSENAVGTTALYIGDTVHVEGGVMNQTFVKGHLYTVTTIGEPNVEVSGDMSCTINFDSFFSMVFGEEGTMTLTYRTDGSRTWWLKDAVVPVNIDMYGIILDDPESLSDGDTMTLHWYRNADVYGYAWMPTEASNVPPEAPIIEHGSWTQEDVDKYTCDVYAPGVLPNSTVIVSPAPESADDYAAAGVLCVGQALETLFFTCKKAPENDIKLSIAII